MLKILLILFLDLQIKKKHERKQITFTFELFKINTNFTHSNCPMRWIICEETLAHPIHELIKCYTIFKGFFKSIKKMRKFFMFARYFIFNTFYQRNSDLK